MQNFTNRHKRAVLYVADVQNILGISARSARRLMNKILQQNNITERNYLTVQEFCIAQKIPESMVYMRIDN
ncbi:MAG: hypothetical protein QM731_28140 [Chitinophagaceae bacterium]